MLPLQNVPVQVGLQLAQADLVAVAHELFARCNARARRARSNLGQPDQESGKHYACTAEVRVGDINMEREADPQQAGDASQAQKNGLYADFWGKVSHRRIPRAPVDGSCRKCNTQKPE